MKKSFAFGIPLAVFLVLAAGVFYWQSGRGLFAPSGAPPQNERAERAQENTTGLPLRLPPGFSIEIFAKNLPGARVMAFDPLGELWVSRTGENAVTLLTLNRDGSIISQGDVLKNLKRPHGLALDIVLGKERTDAGWTDVGGDKSQNLKAIMLYIAEENKISRVSLAPEIGKPEKIADLPAGGGHFTRTIGFGPDGRLYVSIGSTCNVCNESDTRRAKIFSMKKDGSDFKEFARGLRNAVFFTWEEGNDSTGASAVSSVPNGSPPRMWATEMGRDNLGDDLPPDEINMIEGPSTSSGQNSVPNFGWPTCYGKNIHDTEFDKNTYIRNPCMEPFETPSAIDIPAHSAPLGLTFIPRAESRGAWPEEYWGDLLVAYHGSWNRSEPTGYKVVRMKLDDNGRYLGTEDFITGWLTQSGEVLGRPVDLTFDDDGALYVSDDKAGVIYKVEYR